MSAKASKNKLLDTNSILTDKARKPKTSRVSIQGDNSALQVTEVQNIAPHALPSECIILRGRGAEKLLNAERNLIVPTSSPRSDFIFDKSVETIPEKTISVKELNIPYIRMLGIRKSIEILGDFFGCSLYVTSPLQFWFLDMVTDCLWKCQDEFMLNEQHQLSVLEWVLYLFDIIRDPQMNFSRGQFFRIFRETVTLAEHRIECGDSNFPTPEELFDLRFPPEDPVEFDALLSDSTDSSLSFDESDSEQSYLVMPSEEYHDLPDFYKLPTKECDCDISVTSSLETLSEKSIPIEKDTPSQDSDLHYNSEAEINETEISYSVSDFYQPDAKTHSRFLDQLDEEEEESIVSEEVKEEDSELEFEWVNDADRSTSRAIEKPKSIATLSSHDGASVHSGIRKMRSSSTKSKNKPERKSTLDENGSIQTLPGKKSKSKVPKQEKKLGEDELLRAWFEYNLWEQRKKDMADPSKGWKPFEPDLCSEDCFCGQIEYAPEDFENEEYLQIRNEWLQYLEKHKMAIDRITQNIFVNSCLLLIIKQFVFEYFYESFQYKLVKMVYQTVPNLTYEKLNTKWQIPKLNREEFKRPVEKKPKPQKPAKEKAPKGKDKKKKEKEDKKSKSSKGTGKKEKPPKVKPEKPHKLTKEEKEELERLKREEEERINKQIAAEENRRFIFPLTMAANVDFFKSIFKDFVDPSESKDKGKDKKNKKKK